MARFLLLISLALTARYAQKNPCEPKAGYLWLGWDVALVRVAPSAVPGLPSNISGWMENRGYSIPQSYCDSTLHNVIVGSLAREGSSDWAALCSRADSSRLVIFWDGSVDSVTELPMLSDEAFSYACEGREYGYSRLIGLIDGEGIADHNHAVSDSLAFDHQGVEEGICEKGSSVFYWRNGKAFELAGAD